MIYKYLDEITVARVDDDGKSRMSCSIDHPGFKAWLKEGNIPKPADPIPEPVKTKKEIGIEKLKTATTIAGIKSALLDILE